MPDLNQELLRTDVLLRDIRHDADAAYAAIHKLDQAAGGAGKEIRPDPRMQQAQQRYQVNRPYVADVLRSGGAGAYTGIPGGAAGLINFQKAVEGSGFAAGKLVSISKTANGELVRLNMGFKNSTGAVENFSLYMNKAGAVLRDTQGRFRTFGDAIIRDIGKVLEWSIATGIVFGAFQKLNEVIQKSVQIQSQLADVAVVTGGGYEKLKSVLQASAVVADETGSSLEGVISGYKLAYAATGEFTDEVQRTVATQALLKDSMIFSKLAGLEQAQAMDTLVGALRQSGMELTQGRQLLDQWVVTARNANVSINTLASGYAIVGAAAKDVGLDSKELNAVIGTLAESTKLSADETGNALRGFISGFQSAKAQTTLSRYGIALRDVNGELRDFTDVVKELSVLSSTGILNEKDLAVITNAVGGGYRRGAQFAALVKNYERALQLVKLQEDSSGAATGALALKMDTVGTAITRLGNAFTNLAASLGNEGGILSLFTVITKMLTAMVSGVDSLVSSLGAAAPLLAIIGIGAKALPMTNFGAKILGAAAPMGLASLAAGKAPTQYNIPSPYYQVGGAAAQQAYAARVQQAGTLGGAFGLMNQRATGAMKGLPGMGGMKNFQAYGLIGPAINTGAQIAQGDYASAGASVGGAIIGALVTQGSPAGMTIGSVMASAFYEGVIGYKTDFTAAFAAILAAAQGEAPVTEEPGAGTKASLEKGMELTFAQRVVYGLESTVSKMVTGINSVIGREVPVLTPEMLLISDIQQGNRYVTEGQRGSYKGFLGGGETVGGYGIGVGGTEVDALRKKNQLAMASQAATAEQVMIQRARKDLMLGGSGAEYKTAMESTKGLAQQASAIVTAFQLINQPLDTGSLFGVLLNLKPEETLMITDYAEAIMDLTIVIKDLQAAQVGLSGEDLANNLKTITAAREDLNTANIGLSGLKTNLFPVAGMRAKELLPIIDSDATSAQILEAARVGMEEGMRIAIASGFTPEEAGRLAEQWTEILVRGQDGAFTKIKLPTDLFNFGAEKTGITGGGRQIMDLRDQVSSAQLTALMPGYSQIKDLLTGLGVKTNEQDLLILTKDGYSQQHADQSIISMLLEDIKKNGEDQLEGMFNLPSDMAALIPGTGQVYFGKSSYETGGGMGGLVSALQQLVAILSSGTNAGTTALVPATGQAYFSGGHGYGLAAPSTGPSGGGGTAQKDMTYDELKAWYKNYTEKPVPDILRGTSKLNWQQQSYLEAQSKGIQDVGPKEMTDEEEYAARDALYAKYNKGLGTIGTPRFGAGAAVTGNPPISQGPDIGGILQTLFSQIQQLFPQSIPITNKVTLETTNIIYVDSTQVATQVNKSMFTDIKNAKRASGTVGYAVTT